MDKLYCLLECHRLLIGHPNLSSLRAKVEGMLSELEASARADREKADAEAKAAAAPKVVPQSEAPAEDPAPTLERKI